jgi:acetoin utilization deacetylase AcuC-like enzyme
VRKANEEELLLVHSPSMVENIKRVCASGGGWLTPDTAVCPESYQAALWGVGCALSSVEAVLNGQVKSAFALCRPPGHHADREQARGFCLFNNVALTAAYAQEKHGLERIAILDWDLHHGNGTQEIFYDDGQVSFLSLHAYGPQFYPGTGRREEMGMGEGMGHNLNVPLPADCGDEEYEYILERLVMPVLSVWEPQLLLISAGFDAHEKDPFRGMRLTGAGYYRLAERVGRFADEAGIGLVLVLEGGYHLDSLSESVSQCVRALLESGPPEKGQPGGVVSPEVVGLVDSVKRSFDTYWEVP